MSNTIFTTYIQEIMKQVQSFALVSNTRIDGMMTIQTDEQQELHTLLTSKHYTYWLQIKYTWEDLYDMKVRKENHKLIYEIDGAFFDDILKIMQEMHHKKPFGKAL